MAVIAKRRRCGIFCNDLRPAGRAFIQLCMRRKIGCLLVILQGIDFRIRLLHSLFILIAIKRLHLLFVKITLTVFAGKRTRIRI